LQISGKGLEALLSESNL